MLQARIAEEAGAAAVMALERVPADIRKDGGVARMSDPSMIKEIMEAVTIPVMAKARIGHFVECQVSYPQTVWDSQAAADSRDRSWKPLASTTLTSPKSSPPPTTFTTSSSTTTRSPSSAAAATLVRLSVVSLRVLP